MIEPENGLVEKKYFKVDVNSRLAFQRLAEPILSVDPLSESTTTRLSGDPVAIAYPASSAISCENVTIPSYDIIAVRGR